MPKQQLQICHLPMSTSPAIVARVDNTVASTMAINQRANHGQQQAQIWLFGYGSLIFNADFPYLERRNASVQGWSRRFWQGSHDHRGTLDAPGRVLTLIAEADAVCDGIAYLITPAVFAQLDYREKDGYLRLLTELEFDDGSQAQGLIYLARADNAAWLGPAPTAEIAQQIAQARGPSGRNRDYLLKLAAALRGLGKTDAHVFALETLVQQLAPLD